MTSAQPPEQPSSPARQRQDNPAEPPLQDNTTTFTPQVFNGTLPPPQGNIATLLHQIDPITQTTQADQLFTFLQEPTSNLLTLNTDATPGHPSSMSPNCPRSKYSSQAV